MRRGWDLPGMPMARGEARPARFGLSVRVVNSLGLQATVQVRGSSPALPGSSPLLWWQFTLLW